MCASSSTTRTLKLKGAIPSIHHHPVIRVSAGHDGNVNELAMGFGSGLGPGLPTCGEVSPRAFRAPAGWGGTAVLTSPENELQRITHEAEPLPDRLFQVAPVGKIEQSDVVDEHHADRRLRRRPPAIATP